jgi:hypothetical protein
MIAPVFFVLVAVFTTTTKAQRVELVPESLLPILPSIPTRRFCSRVDKETQNGTKFIPRYLWIAVRNGSDINGWANIQREITGNPTWVPNIWDNATKDKFMNIVFANTSLLWAYNLINSRIGGAAKADIWRYAVLFVCGGVYIDADSELMKALDDIIRADDKMLIATESNHFDGDW